MDLSPRNFIPYPPPGWGAPAHADDHHQSGQDDEWAEGASTSNEGWGAPHTATEHTAVDGWGAPVPGGWGAPTAVPAVPADAWGAPPSTGQDWDVPVPMSGGAGGGGGGGGGVGMFNLLRGHGNTKRSGAQHNPPAPTPAAQAPPPASLHPSAAVQMHPAQAWGAPPAAGWGEPTQGWGGHAAPKAPSPPAAKPAWTNWAAEAKMVNTSPHPATYSYPHTIQSAAVGGGIRQVLSDEQRA